MVAWLPEVKTDDWNILAASIIVRTETLPCHLFPAPCLGSIVIIVNIHSLPFFNALFFSALRWVWMATVSEKFILIKFIKIVLNFAQIPARSVSSSPNAVGAAIGNLNAFMLAWELRTNVASAIIYPSSCLRLELLQNSFALDLVLHFLNLFCVSHIFHLFVVGLMGDFITLSALLLFLHEHCLFSLQNHFIPKLNLSLTFIVLL